MSVLKLTQNTARGICVHWHRFNPKPAINVGSTFNIGHRHRSFNCGKLTGYLSWGRTLCDPMAPNGVGAWNMCCQRTYNRKKTMKIPPTKPMNFDYSGDLEKDLKPMDLTLPKRGFEEVQLLKDGDERLKQLFSLKFADGKAIREKRISELMKEVQEHPADIKSYEVKIAQDTIHIRNQMKHVLAMRKDKRTKVNLLERIQSRQKTLKFLRSRDTDKFNWICEKLNLKYIPVPEYNKKLSKRAARKKSARDQSLALKKQKLLEFKASLDRQKDAFKEHKARELEEISSALQSLGIDKMESYEQVVTDMGLGEPYVQKKEKKKTRREQLLELKFRLYKNLPKYQAPT